MKTVALAISLLFLTVAASAGMQIYDLPNVGALAATPILTNPNVYGIAYRQAWDKLEPSLGTYDWTFLDAAKAQAQGAGKAIDIRILTECSATPAWVWGSFGGLGAAQRFAGADGNTIWVYWDAYAHPAMLDMIKAVGQRYGSSVVLSPAIGLTETSGDWACPHAAADITAWRSSTYNYTSAQAVSTVEAGITQMLTYFPSAVISLACGRNGNLDPTPGSPADPDYVCEQVSNWMIQFGEKTTIEKNQFSAFSAPNGSAAGTNFGILQEYYGKVGLRGQMLWWVYGDTTYRMNNGTPGNAQTILNAAFARCDSYGLLSCEVYEVDCLNLDISNP